MIPEITIKITMRPDEVTISQGQSEIREETFTIPSVPQEPDVVFRDEQFPPPVPDEGMLMYSEDHNLPPPEEEADIFSKDENIKPPEVEEHIADLASDDVPVFPIGE